MYQFEHISSTATKESASLAWNPWRRRIKHVLEQNSFLYTLALTITLNFICLVVETDAHAAGHDVGWMHAVTTVMGLAFFVELLVRLYAYRLHFFHDALSCIDALVIVADVVCICIEIFMPGQPDFSIMRIVRMLRVSRTSKIVRLIPELNIILLGLTGALQPLFWGSAMMLLMLLSWSTLAVQLIHPVVTDMVKDGAFQGCGRCPHAFESTWEAALTFSQQIVAGDSWGQVTVPVIEYYPATAIFFAGVFVTLNMAGMNVILASVVDAVAQARQANDEFMSEQIDAERNLFKTGFLAACKAMDRDRNQKLTFEELVHGYGNLAGFQNLLKAMDITEEDLETVWMVLDDKHNGHVTYEEFSNNLFKMKSSNEHTILVFLKAFVTDIRKSVDAGMEILKTEVVSGINAAIDTLRQENRKMSEVLRLLHSEDKQLHDVTSMMRSSLSLGTSFQNSSDTAEGRMAVDALGPASIDQKSKCVPSHEQLLLTALRQIENNLEANLIELTSVIANATPRINPTLELPGARSITTFETGTPGNQGTRTVGRESEEAHSSCQVQSARHTLII